MYTDIHCHLLPGVDDGVATWEESEQCLAIARDEDISAICVTPHIWPPKYANTPEALRAAFDAWKDRAGTFGIELSLGSEVYYLGGLAQGWEAGRYLSLGASKYLLVELPLLVPTPGLAQAFFELRLKGVEPVLAHPERYAFAARNPALLEPLAASSTAFQLTTHSVAGFFGEIIQRTAFYILEQGWAVCLASDAHSPTNRTPMFGEAVSVIEGRYGAEAARQLCVENPRRLLLGKPVEPVPCERPRRRFWG